MRAVVARTIKRGTILDGLFDRWEETYPPADREGFHRDGIVREDVFAQQPWRLLFVLAEPNSRDGKYDKYFGHDLRIVFGDLEMAKSVNQNLALWTQVLLDRADVEQVDPLDRVTGLEASRQLRRVAIMNVKKLPGSGNMGVAGVEAAAWRDREFIREEVTMIRPDVIVTGGAVANRALGRALTDRADFDPSVEQVWRFGFTPILPTYHPAQRIQRNSIRAFLDVIERAEAAAIAAFSRPAQS